MHLAQFIVLYCTLSSTTHIIIHNTHHQHQLYQWWWHLDVLTRCTLTDGDKGPHVTQFHRDRFSCHWKPTQLHNIKQHYITSSATAAAATAVAYSDGLSHGQWCWHLQGNKCNYTVPQKSEPPNWWWQLCQTLTDFQNSFTVGERNKL